MHAIKNSGPRFKVIGVVRLECEVEQIKVAFANIVVVTTEAMLFKERFNVLEWGFCAQRKEGQFSDGKDRKIIKKLIHAGNNTVLVDKLDPCGRQAESVSIGPLTRWILWTLGANWCDVLLKAVLNRQNSQHGHGPLSASEFGKKMCEVLPGRGSIRVKMVETADKYEEFVEVFTRHEADLRRFVRSLMPSWHDADEVMQQVALVAWRKFDEFDRDTDFVRWGCVIARFESLAYRRKMARDKLVFREDLIALMAEEAENENDERQRENEALEGCLKKLPEGQRKLVTLAYTPGMSTRALAEAAGVKPGTFYMRLNRIRRSLQECIRHKLAQEGMA